MNVQAQDLIISGTPIKGPLDDSIGTLGGLISKVLSFLFPFAAVILLIMLIWGGYGYMTSGGEPDKVESAKARITTSIIGFVLLTLSFFLAKVVAFVFGLDDNLLF